MEEEDSSLWKNGRKRCEVKSYAVLLDDEDAQRTRAWRLWYVSEEAREAEQQHWKASVWKRLRMEQKVKEILSGENGQRVDLEFIEADRVENHERERCRH